MMRILLERRDAAAGRADSHYSRMFLFCTGSPRRFPDKKKPRKPMAYGASQQGGFTSGRRRIRRPLPEPEAAGTRAGSEETEPAKPVGSASLPQRNKWFALHPRTRPNRANHLCGICNTQVYVWLISRAWAKKARHLWRACAAAKRLGSPVS